jgi:site-specific DNA-methyltransferase (cytosine-N4-specific)
MLKTEFYSNQTVAFDPIPSLVSCDWNFPGQRNGEGLYNLHPYPAKFISQIPKTLIKTIGIPKDTVVLDPFCGYGTTLIAAQSLGYSSIGVDLNPIACLIARVSTQDCSQNIVESSTRCVQKAKATEGLISIPYIPNLDHWFKKPIQIAVFGLITAINEIEEENLRDALRLALSSILVRVSNQDSDTRYAAINKLVEKDDVYSIFSRVCQQYMQVLHSSQEDYPNAFVLNKNILEVSPSDIPRKVGLVISSPPYPAAYEYWLYHKYRMWWLGFDPLSVKEHEIGARSHFFKKDHHTPKDFENQMQKVFKLLSKICTPNSYACFVVGNSKIHGEIIDNTELLISAAVKENFELRTILPRNIPSNRKSFNLSNSRILTENIIILQK